MREIKFRAWDGEKMHYAACFSFEQVNPFPLAKDKRFVFQFDGIESGENLYGATLNNPEIMEWTGLKDKNGTEIYEGDIVRATSGVVGFIKYHNGRFVWTDGGCNWDLIQDIDKRKTIRVGDLVIGNLYENRDLLK